MKTLQLEQELFWEHTFSQQ